MNETNIKVGGYYIGHSTDTKIRFEASSGGIGTAITRYLLSLPEYETGITLVFDRDKCQYVPHIIHSADEINVCGSVYHDIDIPRFLRENAELLTGGVIITCAPCHVSAVRQFLSKSGHRCFIISYCCSGQTTIEGTWKYYELLGLDRKDVTNMQYRGNGWPSGIQIWLADGRKVCKDNYTEPWVTLHASKLYTPKRCFYCKRDTGRNADISLADPWLKEYKDNDKCGNTLFMPFTEEGAAAIGQMKDNGLIEYVQSSYDDYSIAQAPNIKKELFVQTQKKYIQNQLKIMSYGWYWKFASKDVRHMRMHIKLMQYVYKFSSKKNFMTSLMNLAEKIKRRLRYYSLKGKLAKSNGYINIGGGKNN